jgi:hypothetical protein
VGEWAGVEAEDFSPGNAILLNGATQIANREIGVPEFQALRFVPAVLCYLFVGELLPAGQFFDPQGYFAAFLFPVTHADFVSQKHTPHRRAQHKLFSSPVRL